jgi:hypothetical protein
VLCAAAPAAADVTLDPPTAPQGGGLDVTFHVTNDNPRSPMTRVRLVLPADTPVAEVYPLSVDDWAPQMIIRELDTPLAGIHGGIPVTQITAAIVWTAMPGRGIPPGGTADLSVSMGPLPASAQMRFTVQPTYADGSALPAVAPVSLALTPATAAGGTGHTGHDTGAAPGGEVGAGEVRAGEPAGTSADQGPGVLSMAGWIVAVLIAVAAGVALLRARRHTEPTRHTEPASAPETGITNTAGQDREPVRVTAWSYRDGP